MVINDAQIISSIDDIFITIKDRGKLLATATVAFCGWFEISGFRICEVPFKDENGRNLHVFPPVFDSQNPKRSVSFFTRAPTIEERKKRWRLLRDLILRAYDEAVVANHTFYSTAEKRGYDAKESEGFKQNEEEITDEDLEKIDKHIV